MTMKNNKAMPIIFFHNVTLTELPKPILVRNLSTVADSTKFNNLNHNFQSNKVIAAQHEEKTWLLVDFN